MKNVIHVTPRTSGGWQVKTSGCSRPTVISPTKEAAINQSKRIAKTRDATVLVHGKDGKIQKGINNK